MRYVKEMYLNLSLIGEDARAAICNFMQPTFGKGLIIFHASSKTPCIKARF